MGLHAPANRASMVTRHWADSCILDRCTCCLVGYNNVLPDMDNINDLTCRPRLCSNNCCLDTVQYKNEIHQYLPNWINT